MKAIWKDQIIAESDQTILVEGNHYFPPQSVNEDFLLTSDKTSACPWKGNAKYYTLEVNGDQNPDAAWYYPEPKDAATEIAGHIAFWRGVQVIK